MWICLKNSRHLNIPLRNRWSLLEAHDLGFFGGPNRFETRKHFRPVLDVKSVQENHSPSNDDRPRK